jgi:ketosteroid isomerase-like protein
MNVIDRLLIATNAHDVDAIAACFADDYALESPLHPARSFRGREQVKKNWTQILGGVPELKARIVARAIDGDTIWTEWEMGGARRDGARQLMRGVFVFAVDESRGLIRSGRMFLEPVDASADDMDAAIKSLFGAKP